MGSGLFKVYILDENRNILGVQHPLPTDGDSVYSKDVWTTESDIGDFTGGEIYDLFDDLHTVIQNTTSDNPKTLVVHFKRTIIANVVGIGCYGGGNFSNVKVEIVNSGPVYTTVFDGSSDDTKRTNYTIPLPITAGFNALRITFHTSDTVCLSNVVIPKTRGVVARLQAAKPDNTVTDINATTGGNLKFSLEEFESETFESNPLPVQIRSSNGEEVLYIEQLTNGIPNINTDHALIHQGYGFSFSDIITSLGSAATFSYCLTSPTDRYIHLKNVNVQALGGSIKVEILIGASVTVNTGTIVPLVNLNHNSSITAQSSIRKSPTYTGGTSARAIYALSDSTNQTVGTANFNSNPNQEFITQDGSYEYIVKVTNLTTETLDFVTIEGFMYEETQGLAVYS